MKKTVTANIAGTVFHIEEDAYEQLQRYLAGIRANFSGSPGAEEIMGDIESRIAELFTERLTGRGVVTIDDVRHVESVMGRPEDFAAEGATGVPPMDAGTPGTATGRRRFMRDTEDKWLGGVLGGLGSFIGMDPLWLRIAMIVLVMASVGSLIPIYILLWILVPKAETAADRLMMRGEPVTVENIKRVVEEGAEKFKQGGERLANEAKDLGKDWGPRAQHWGRGATDYAGRAASNAGNVLRKLVGVVIIVAAFTLFLTLVTGLIGGSVSLWSLATWNSDSMGMLDLGGMIFNSRSHALWLAIGAFILVAVPIMALFLAGFRLLLDTRTPKWLGWSLAVLWFSALVPTTIAGITAASDFRRQNSLRSEFPLNQPTGNMLYLDAIPASQGDSDWRLHYDDGDVEVDMDGIYVENGTVYGAWADLDVATSPDSLYHLVVERDARARNSKEALARAERIAYDCRQEGDALLVSPVIRFSMEDKLRAQDAHFILQLPLGGSVFFRPGSKHIIYDVDNVTNTLDRDMIGRRWTMTPGGLKDSRTISVEPAATPGDSTKKGPMAATVWHGPKRTQRKPAPPPPVRTVTASEEGSVQLPSLLNLLSRVVAL
jgi:phage shock protein PspC (stress-responsive transcriptional regulator)